MKFSTKVVCLTLLLSIVGIAQAHGFYYETHRWAFGECPHRIGLVGIEDSDGRVATTICLGNEIRDDTPGWAFTVPLPIYVVALMGGLPIVLAAGFGFKRLRRRHAKAV